ncbi:lipocalin family protein [Pseudothioclava arenosa]|nr:lipocalin family protein [Pseudothioclava arenosa]
MRGLIRLAGAMALAGALAGCLGAPEPGGPLLSEPGRMSSLALFEPVRMAGGWQVVASGTPGCAGARQDWAAEGGGYRISGIDCAGAAPMALDARMSVTGPGARMAASGRAFGGAPVWLLWADQDYRVAVLGTPEGGFGMILARPGMAARGDLIAAAREVLAFNGYDLAQIGP